VYPIGIHLANGPWLYFGSNLDDKTEMVRHIDGVDFKDIEGFRRIHSYLLDTYNGDEYIFRNTKA
jgi:hypothetical protein